MRTIKLCRNLIFSVVVLGNFFNWVGFSKSEEIFDDSLEITNEINLNYLKRFPQSNYIIAPGDALKIVVSRDYPELNTTSIIDGEGTIFLPLINRVYVEGLTLTELNKLLTKSFADYVKYPSLQIQVVNYRPIKILVNGEVNQPGLYVLKGSQQPNSFNNSTYGSNLDSVFDFNNSNDVFKSFSTKARLMPNEVSVYFPRVFDAIRASGGVTQYSDLSNITVIRKNKLSDGGGKIMTTLNFLDAISNGDSSQNVRIYDDDIINIKKLDKPNPKLLGFAIRSNLNPKYIRVFVSGMVNDSGIKTLTKSSTLNDAIDIAGGSKVLRGPIRFVSFNSDGSIEKRNISYRKRNKRGSLNNPYLKDGDLIIIGTSILSNATEFLKEVTSPFVGLYSTYSFFDTVFD